MVPECNYTIHEWSKGNQCVGDTNTVITIGLKILAPFSVVEQIYQTLKVDMKSFARFKSHYFYLIQIQGNRYHKTSQQEMWLPQKDHK